MHNEQLILLFPKSEAKETEGKKVAYLQHQIRYDEIERTSKKYEHNYIKITVTYLIYVD